MKDDNVQSCFRFLPVEEVVNNPPFLLTPYLPNLRLDKR